MTAFLASLSAATISATTPTVPDLSSVSPAVGLTGSLPRNMPNNGKVGYGMFSLINESVISVNGYGNYCSKTWPTGGSSFGYISNGGDPCAYISLPEDDVDAQYKLLSNLDLRLAYTTPLPEVKRVSSFIEWNIRQLIAKHPRVTRADDEVPSRRTLLPPGYLHE